MSLGAMDRRLSAHIHSLELPRWLEALVAPFGCLHGYVGTGVVMPLLWFGACAALGQVDSHGWPGWFLYMYTAAVGQVMSRCLKILLRRTRPGMDVSDKAQLPRRHFLPGSPAYIAAYPLDVLQQSLLVRVGGMQRGHAKGGSGAMAGDSGAFPSGDSMGGAAFGVMLAYFTPLGFWGGVCYAALPAFARVYYWFHWLADVLAGAATAALAGQIVLWLNDGDMAACTLDAFFLKALPAFAIFSVVTHFVAKALQQ